MRISDWSSDVCSSDLLEAAGLPVRCYANAIPGLTIIDTTDVSRGSTGHSNFLRSAVVCRDFVDVVAGKRARPERSPPRLAHVFRLLPDPSTPKDMDDLIDRKRTPLNSSHKCTSRMPSSS